MSTGMFCGAFELEGQGVRGWARHTLRPDPVWLELLVDDCVLGAGRADLPEPEACGFWLPMPPVIFEEGGVVRVRVANTDAYIGSALSLEDGRSPGGLQGELHHDGGLTLSGWVLDTLDPKRKIRITAWTDGLEVTGCLACDRRFSPEKGDGHGFLLTLPSGLADGNEHLVSLRDESGREMPGAPVRVRLLPQGAADWLEGRNRLDPPQKRLLCDLLRHQEPLTPHAQGLTDYTAWKEAFPVPALTLKGKISVAVLACGDCGEASSLLRRQTGVDCRVAADGAECALLLQEGERLHPRALAHLATVLRESGAGLVYADSETEREEPGDVREDSGIDGEPDLLPLFKPAWDREAFFGRDYLGPLLVSRAVLEAVVPSWASGMRDAGTYAALRVRLALCAEQMGGIRHVPLILSREVPVHDGEARRAAMREWLPSGCVVEALDDPRLSRVRYPLSSRPCVSVIIPTRDHADLLRRCLDSLACTAWESLEMLIVDNGSTCPDALALLEETAAMPRVRVLHRPGVFNYADINNFAVKEARGELLCFLNNDTEALSADWLEVMVSLLLADASHGCVGAKLIWPNGLVQHGGVIVGTHQLAAHVGNQWLEDDPGYMDRNRLVQQYSAVTAACMLTHRQLFLDLGGFDARRFPVAFNDVDYCLRVRASGRKILWTPLARLLHHESASRGRDISPMNRARATREMRLFRTRWGGYEDPFHNPNLPLSTVVEPFHGLALPPRTRSFR